MASIITIDGPAGAGKSSIAKALAEELSFTHLDSGAIYRLIGYLLDSRGISLNDRRKVEDTLNSISIGFKGENVFLNGRNVTSEVRLPKAADEAARVAKVLYIRKFVVRTLRDLAKGKNVIVDGRDAGTNIFPNANVKLFLTASASERARRRYRDLIAKGFSASYHDVLGNIEKRDREDRNRKIAPLVVPKGAVVIDTTGKSFKDVLTMVKEEVLSCLRKSKPILRD